MTESEPLMLDLIRGRGLLFANKASAVTVLLAVVEREPSVQALLEAGPSLAPKIAQLIRVRGVREDDAGVTCLSWLLYKLDPALAAKTLGEVLGPSLGRPGFFFTHFAAQVVREQAGLTTKPGMFYTPDEVKQTVRELGLPGYGDYEAYACVVGIRTRFERYLDSVYLCPSDTSTDPTRQGVCSYEHFDRWGEVLGETLRYNSWGFTFLPRRFVIGDDKDVDKILRDNCLRILPDKIRPGDIIRYYRISDRVTAHTGRVYSVFREPGCPVQIRVRSKLGRDWEAIHNYDDTWIGYWFSGNAVDYFRQEAPLKGIADLWIRTHPSDTGEQHCVSAFWESPDIWVDAPPYDGIPDAQPVIGQPNRIAALVRNRGEKAVENVYIRYYWTAATVGTPPLESWNLIAEKGPFSVPGYAGMLPTGPPAVFAPVATWTPRGAAPVHQCLLAVAFVKRRGYMGICPGDDPKDSFNPDPLVYPWEPDFPAWDNNIAMRNVWAIRMATLQVRRFSLVVRAPSETRPVAGRIEGVLSSGVGLPVMGLPASVPLLDVVLTLGGRSEKLVSIEEHVPRGVAFMPDDALGQEAHLGGVVLPYRLTGGKARHELQVRIKVPRNAKPGAVYYLRLAQNVDGCITGGYTVVVRIV
ncbi:MAG: hypothetical protein JW759_03920 [Candidatus Coatesbacteria bacterium]|nr:hypothetical protein [Candidatus Coatesbacteria bacterium]